ncbi:response regulator transcription factor [Streptomyces sp. ME02-8801-2C]|uniref:response regulator transcription factor n=1 Tax=Streptomyces sp. ME02-8801-2C TaxID=3028680 RepID=UPI0029BF96B9|nr:response regulator transcription factor [Streptomyces sp. ME02-8801-2C]MDX3456250.1 response regulator transcription factor [Streptomyces sp. ME02-8801-2C]
MNQQVVDSDRPRQEQQERQDALRVLVVESETQAADALVQELRRHGHLARSVPTAALALQAHPSVDLVLLDLDLPDLDGLEVCRRIRAVGDVPIITVTTRGAELDRVLGLQAGSDDYVVKPYGFRELLARMEAVMRRARPRPASTRQQVITYGPLRIDTRIRELLLEGRRVDLTPKEFDLLHLLASQPDTTLSRRQLMSQVWDDDWSHRGRTIDTHVSSLRGKLGSSNWIVTVRGVGFRLGHP